MFQPLRQICPLGANVGSWRGSGQLDSLKAFSPALTKRVQCLPVYRPGQPGAESVRVAAFRQPLPYPENGILADIFRQVNIGHDCMGHGQGCPRMPSEQHTKGRIIAGAGAGEKNGIGARVSLQRR